MKLAFINNFELAAVTDAGVVNLSDAVAEGLNVLPPQQLMNHVIEHWSDYGTKFAALVEAGSVQPMEDITLRAPLPKPISIACMAVNYMEFGALKEKPEPQAFLKNSHSVIGPGETMNLPDVPASIFEAEAELALVIGKTAKNVKAEDAYDYIFGYLNFVDGSSRGLSMGMGMPYFMKCQDDSAPLGPWIVTADEVANPMNLRVQQWNNGEPTHDYNTDDMAHDIAASLAFVSANTTLEAGDVIALGTNHQGLHPLQDGDLVEQEIEGLGRLAFHVHDDHKRTWSRETRAERRSNKLKGPAPQLTGTYAET